MASAFKRGTTAPKVRWAISDFSPSKKDEEDDDSADEKASVISTSDPSALPGTSTHVIRRREVLVAFELFRMSYWFEPGKFRTRKCQGGLNELCNRDVNAILVVAKADRTNCKRKGSETQELRLKNLLRSLYPKSTSRGVRVMLKRIESSKTESKVQPRARAWG